MICHCFVRCLLGVDEFMMILLLYKTNKCYYLTRWPDSRIYSVYKRDTRINLVGLCYSIISRLTLKCMHAEMNNKDVIRITKLVSTFFPLSLVSTTQLPRTRIAASGARCPIATPAPLPVASPRYRPLLRVAIATPEATAKAASRAPRSPAAGQVREWVRAGVRARRQGDRIPCGGARR